MFAITAIAIVGFVGLGTEVGIWYLVRREAQGAADAAAIAGALAANAAKSNSTDPGSAAATSSYSLASTNGFADGSTNSLTQTAVSVTPAYLPNSYNFTSPFAGDVGTAFSLDEVGVTISEQVIPLISSMFGGKGVTVGASAVAVVEPLAQVCALSLAGDLSISAGTISAADCALASDASDGTAINVGAGAALSAEAVTAVGGCCGSGSVTLGSAQPGFGLGAPAAYHPPTVNPFGSTDPNGSPDAIAFPTFAGATCASAPTVNPQTGVIPLVTYESSGQAYCSDVVVDTTSGCPAGVGCTLQFLPGTTIFYNASLTVTGENMQCLGCSSGNGAAGMSVAILGSGTLNLSNAVVAANMPAPISNTGFPELSGVLFYGNGSNPVNLLLTSPANSALSIVGGVYFPNATLTFTAVHTSSCLSLVAGTLILYGTFSLDVDRCASAYYNTPVALMLGARIVQ